MSEDRQRVSHNRMDALPRVDGLALPERLLAGDDVPGIEDRYIDFGAGLVSLGFIRAAIRRAARFWCAMAVAGLLAGLASYLAYPPGYRATTSVWLTYGPYESSTTGAMDDQLVAQSRAVAAIALHKLGLTQSASSFITDYTAVALSPRVLQITVTAPTGNDALRRARAVAAAFLKFRAGQLEAEQNLTINSIHHQISQAKLALASVSTQIRSVSAQPVSSAQQARLTRLRAQRSQQASTLAAVQQGASAGATKTATTLAIKGSDVLDAAALLSRSRLRAPLERGAIGLLAGLALSLGIVVIVAITSDRLRRREDIARALGAPVRLSVPKVSLSRWRPSRYGELAAAGTEDVSRVVMHLRSAVALPEHGSANLAVVPVDDVEVAAVCLASLATTLAREGSRVVVADLCMRAPAARVLGVRGAGVREVRIENARVVVAVPDRDRLFPVDPLRGRSHGTGGDDDVAAVCASADVLLTLAELDPAVGGEYLSAWTSNVVAFVTAGRSSADRIRAVGEMIRLARIPHVSAVLVGADKTDESLGASHAPSVEYRPARV